MDLITQALLTGSHRCTHAGMYFLPVTVVLQLSTHTINNSFRLAVSLLLEEAKKFSLSLMFACFSYVVINLKFLS